MKDDLYFFVIFLATIFVIRIFLYIKPIPAPTIKNFRIHHYMYGLVIALLGFFLKNITLYAIGMGLFVDELGYLLIGGKTHKDNYSALSFLLLCLFVILIYIFRKQILHTVY